MIPSRLGASLLIILAVATSGCLFGSTMTIECDLSPGLMTQDDCDHAVQTALRMLPDDSEWTKIVVAPGCPGYWKGCPGDDASIIGVEITFGETTQRAQFAVDRNTWKSGGATYTSEAPSTP